MKKEISFNLFKLLLHISLFIILINSMIFADEIILKDETAIECVILQVTPKDIIYNPINSDSKESIDRISVKKIRYSDGKEVQIEETIINLENANKQIKRDPIFMIKNFYEVSALFLDIENKENIDGDDRISYIPNNGNKFGVTIEFYGFGISYSLSGFNKRDESKYGKTKANDIQLFYYTDNLGFDFYYQKYKGFYLDNPSNFNYQVGDSETIRSDLKMTTYGLNFYYNIFDLARFGKNKRTNLAYLTTFSFLNTFEQIKRQENGISIAILVGLSMQHFNIDSSYSLIPEDHQIYYGEFSTFKGGTFNSIGISLGPTISLSFHNFFISIITFIGGGYMHKEYEMEDKTKKETGIFDKINGKIVLGYNGQMFSYGLKFHMDETNSNKSSESINVKSQIMDVQFFFGFKI